MTEALEEYRVRWPLKEYHTSGGNTIKYRWHKNDGSDKVLVLLIGTIGNSDAFHEIFSIFAEDYSVLTFDYPEELEHNSQIADAAAELIGSLCEKAWLLGQSLGGFVAQIITKRHPDLVEGLVLSNTASLAKDMSPAAFSSLGEQITAQSINQKLVSIAPMDLIKRRLTTVDPKLEASFTESQKARSEAFSQLTMDTLTRERLRHSLTMVTDLPMQFGMLPEDFAFLEGRVLLLLSPDDTMFFSEDCRKALIELMPSPAVDRSLTGGHLAIFLDPEAYASKVSAFIKGAS